MVGGSLQTALLIADTRILRYALLDSSPCMTAPSNRPLATFSRSFRQTVEGKSRNRLCALQTPKALFPPRREASKITTINPALHRQFPLSSGLLTGVFLRPYSIDPWTFHSKSKIAVLLHCCCAVLRRDKGFSIVTLSGKRRGRLIALFWSWSVV